MTDYSTKYGLNSLSTTRTSINLCFRAHQLVREQKRLIARHGRCVHSCAERGVAAARRSRVHLGLQSLAHFLPTPRHRVGLGCTAVDIRVCHVWSPLEGFQEAQADSCFRISTLEDFLFNPRCKFLLGLGRGDFNIFTQNCEHAAHWCMTGEQWCKQTLTKVKGRVPFEKRLVKEDVDALVKQVEEIKEISRSVVSNVLKLSGSSVFLRVKGNHYVQVQADGTVGIVPQGDDPTTCGRTAFRLECYARGYNSIRVRFFHEDTGCYMFSRSTFSCFRDLRMKEPMSVRGKSGLTWEYSTLGYLRSMNQHRRGVHAAGYPPVTRTYNHEKSIQYTESQSMRDYKAAERIKSSPASSTTTPTTERAAAVAALPTLVESLGAVMGNANSRAVKVEALRPGDHIFIWDRTNWPLSYQHHGIVWAFSVPVLKMSGDQDAATTSTSTIECVKPQLRVKNISSLRPGDHICIWDYSRWPFSYQHHGIVWASSDQPQDIRVCHVWSPLQGYKEAQADSCFRISTLEEFLYNRSLDDLRLVEYHTSAFRDFLSKWGEVHRGKSDLPEVVLARCKFLLGLGKGDFNIFTQNCEHAAHWCKTGQQWSKQILTKVRGRVPFENRLAKEDVDAMEKEIVEIKAVSRTVVNNVLRLSGSKVYLRVQGNKYVRITDDGLHVDVVPQGDNPETCGRTAFRLECYSKQYNCVKVAFYHEESGRYMFSRSTLSCFRDLRMKKANCLRGTSGMRWEYSSGGHLNSMNSTADTLELVTTAIANGQTGPYVPPDITLIKRSYNHAKSVEETRSQSMLELEEERRGLQDATPL
ncbi:LRAT-like domain [Phytophthora cactorum]|nr:LRAT-like domain [Phytophthora cactorum]